MHLDLRKLYLFNLKIQVAEPVVNILLVKVLDSAKLVEVHIDASEEQRNFEAAFIKNKFGVNKREYSPGNHIILWNGV